MGIYPLPFLLSKHHFAQAAKHVAREPIPVKAWTAIDAADGNEACIDVIARDLLIPRALAVPLELHPGKFTCAMKKPSYFLLYWMVNRDPYNGLL